MTENRLTLLERKQNSLLASFFFVFFFETADPHSRDILLWFWEDLGIDGTEAAWLILPSQIQSFNKSLLLMTINHQNPSTCHYWGFFFALPVVVLVGMDLTFLLAAGVVLFLDLGWE